jgi:hypothetical protein
MTTCSRQGSQVWVRPFWQENRLRVAKLKSWLRAPRFEGAPRVNAVKGTWQDNHTLLIDRLVLGLGGRAERWTLTFDGEKLNVRAEIGAGREISIDGETGRLSDRD